jgi:hypothetical protein
VQIRNMTVRKTFDLIHALPARVLGSFASENLTFTLASCTILFRRVLALRILCEVSPRAVSFPRMDVLG